MKSIFMFLSLLLSACASQPQTSVAQNPIDDLSEQAETAAPVAVKGVLSSVPFTLHDNRMLVDVTLNGQGPFVMIFDTGAPNMLTPETMKLLELRSQGPDMNRSAHRPAKDTVHVRSVELGTYKLDSQKFAVANLDKIRKAFQFSHLDGVIGLEFLNNARVRIDFDRNRIQFLTSDAAPLENEKKMKFETFADKPVVEGEINGKKARILIDTGDRSNLTLFRKFAHKSRIEKIFHNRDEVVTGMGLSGPIPGKLASVQSVELGGREVKDVLARLPMTRRGYFYTPKVSASAGVGLLKAFNIEIDMREKTVALQSRKNFSEDSTFTPVRKVKR